MSVAARVPRILRVAALVGLGFALGLAPMLLRDKHAATPERLTGTVTWSNQETRQIVFQDEDGSREYFVAAVYWTDVAGQLHPPIERPMSKLPVSTAGQAASVSPVIAAMRTPSRLTPSWGSMVSAST